jgi:hypothetical protein
MTNGYHVFSVESALYFHPVLPGQKIDGLLSNIMPILDMATKIYRRRIEKVQLGAIPDEEIFIRSDGILDDYGPIGYWSTTAAKARGRSLEENLQDDAKILKQRLRKIGLVAIFVDKQISDLFIKNLDKSKIPYHQHLLN